MPLPENQATQDRPRTAAGVSFGAKLEFVDIYHAYGASPTLSGVTLSAEPGEILCLLGASGAGKTTLLRIAAGIERQTSGALFLNGRKIAGEGIFMPPDKRGVGLMFQDFALFPHMSVLENVRYGLTALSRAEAGKQAAIALRRVGLGEMMESYPHMLSGGEQQRVALARALAPRPAVLLMDEPFSGLDSRLKDDVRAQTMAILRESRVTAIIVTHDSEEAMRLADRIALLKDGELVQVGTAQSLYETPQTLFAAAFFSELNQFDGVVEDGKVDTPFGAFACAFADGEEVTAAVRLAGIHAEPGDAAVPGRILSRRYAGDTEILSVGIANSDRPVQARIRAASLPSGLRDISLSVNQRDVLVFAREAAAS